MKIKIKYRGIILGKIYSDSVEYPISINYAPEDGPIVTLELNPPENSFNALSDFEISDEFGEMLSQEKSIQKLPPAIEKEANDIRTHLTTAIKRVLNSIKYMLKQIELQEELFGINGLYWSLDKKEWKIFPGGKLSMVFSSRDIISLNEGSAKQLEDYLTDGPEPFLAQSFLHRAKTEKSPKYRWIDATIAAELAIKEVLIRFKPEIETVLMEVPSPPLYKLYGAILESYTGQRSPKLKEIAEGAKVRNLLVHRPEKIKIDNQESINYVEHVEEAIGHLFNILYPSYYQKHWLVGHYKTYTS